MVPCSLTLLVDQIPGIVIDKSAHAWCPGMIWLGNTNKDLNGGHEVISRLLPISMVPCGPGLLMDQIPGIVNDMSNFLGGFEALAYVKWRCEGQQAHCHAKCVLNFDGITANPNKRNVDDEIVIANNWR